MNNSQYEQVERSRMYAKQLQVENAPLSERKEAQTAYFEAMRDTPERVAERISWLFNGSYGHAEMQYSVEIAKNKRMNRVANLSSLIAQEEWSCPQKMAIEAWKKLTDDQKRDIDGAIQNEIDSFLEEELTNEVTK